MLNKPILVSENIVYLTLKEVNSLFEDNHCGMMISKKDIEIEKGDILRLSTEDPKNPYLWVWVLIRITYKTEGCVFLILAPTYQPRDFSIDTCTILEE